ncbi:hypothetical protein GQ457_11G014930 [Hibiscus cannabinus]
MVALFVLALSLASLVAHLSMTKFSSMNLSQYSAKEALSHDIPNTGSPLKIKRTKRLWGDVRSLTSLQPYANPRNSYPESSKGHIPMLCLEICWTWVSHIGKWQHRLNEVLPKLKKAKVVGLIITDGGCLQSILPTSMYEFQRLRCRVAFHALQFRPEIQILGLRMVERLQASGQPFLAYHLGLIRDTLAYHGCAELNRDVHTELIQYRRAQLIKQGIISDELSVDSHMQRENGSCPLMPEEVGLLLRAMGYPSETIIYLTGSKKFGGQCLLIPLPALFRTTYSKK